MWAFFLYGDGGGLETVLWRGSHPTFHTCLKAVICLGANRVDDTALKFVFISE